MNLELIFKGGMKMKKIHLELSTHEVETIIYALYDDMANFDDDSEYYMDLLKLVSKIRKEYEKCLLLD